MSKVYGPRWTQLVVALSDEYDAIFEIGKPTPSGPPDHLVDTITQVGERGVCVNVKGPQGVYEYARFCGYPYALYDEGIESPEVTNG